MAWSTLGKFTAYDGIDIVDALAKCRPTWITLRAVRRNRTISMDISSVLVNALGLAATSASLLLWLPQARTTWQNRNDSVRLTGISAATQWLLLSSSLLWGTYGLAIQSVWVAVPNIVSIFLSVATIVILRRGRSLPPITKSIPIIMLDEPVSVSSATATSSVILTGQRAEAGELRQGHTNTATGSMPVFL